MPKIRSVGGATRILGRLLIVLGALVLVAGAATWFGVAAQLKAEKIPINGDTPFMNSVFGSAEGEEPKQVTGPLGAIAQAEGIKKHTEALPESFGFKELNGQTAGEIAHIRTAKDYTGAGSEEADGRMTALWNMMNTSSFLRSSLMLTAMAFGVALLVAGIGLVVILTGLGLSSAGKALAGAASTEALDAASARAHAPAPVIQEVPITVAEGPSAVAAPAVAEPVAPALTEPVAPAAPTAGAIWPEPATPAPLAQGVPAPEEIPPPLAQAVPAATEVRAPAEVPAWPAAPAPEAS